MKFKKVAMMVFALATAMSGMAQESYIVKTKNAKKTVAKQAETNANGESTEEEEPTATDFVGANFKYHSLCDWKEGMKFMVMPEKYDLVVNTFCDASNEKEVSSGKLMHKIMVYKNHTDTPEGFARINFVCEDDGKAYYYQVPNGTFDDYCYGKMGVPTLAYLGDVDIARSLLMGKTLYTRTTLYREDIDFHGDGYAEVKVPANEEVKVVAVGVGSRKYPVKIIVADKNGKEFYQSVAMSKTNCGMRDDEFIMDNAKFTFYGSFELADENIAAAKAYSDYIGKTYYTRYRTTMTNEQGKKVTIMRLSNFTIKAIKAQNGTKYMKLTLKSLKTGEVFYKDVCFVHDDNVAGDIDGHREDYFSYLFIKGTANMKGIPANHVTAIQQGRVLKGMSKESVKMAKGSPDRTVKSGNGREDWIYANEGVIIKFDKNGKVL